MITAQTVAPVEKKKNLQTLFILINLETYGVTDNSLDKSIRKAFL